jgi:hypothetical protein
VCIFRQDLQDLQNSFHHEAREGPRSIFSRQAAETAEFKKPVIPNPDFRRDEESNLLVTLSEANGSVYSAIFHNIHFTTCPP